jgi:hypothetical protein
MIGFGVVGYINTLKIMRKYESAFLLEMGQEKRITKLQIALKKICPHNECEGIVNETSYIYPEGTPPTYDFSKKCVVCDYTVAISECEYNAQYK